MRLAEPWALAAAASGELTALLYMTAWISVLVIVGFAVIIGVMRWWQWQRTQPMRLAGRKGRSTQHIDAWRESARRYVLKDNDDPSADGLSDAADDEDDDEDGGEGVKR